MRLRPIFKNILGRKINKHRCSYCKYWFLSAFRDSYGSCLKKDGQIRGFMHRNIKDRKCFVKETDKKKARLKNHRIQRKLWPTEY